MSVDLTDPVTARFIARVVALPPREWDEIDRRIERLAEEQAKKPLPPGILRVLRISARLHLLFGPMPPQLARMMVRMLEANVDALERTQLGPAWRRQGTGPIRHLVEVLERPWVSRSARAYVYFVLTQVWVRGWLREDDFLREMYAPFEPVIPWASLLPPLLPATSGTTGA